MIRFYTSAGYPVLRVGRFGAAARYHGDRYLHVGVGIGIRGLTLELLVVLVTVYYVPSVADQMAALLPGRK